MTSLFVIRESYTKNKIQTFSDAIYCISCIICKRFGFYLSLDIENHAHEGHCRCEEYCMRIAARENYHRLF